MYGIMVIRATTNTEHAQFAFAIVGKQSQAMATTERAGAQGDSIVQEMFKDTYRAFVF